MDDVTRLFRALVRHLAEHDPRRLSAPFQISELYQSLVPYRLFKAELQFGSIDDYEMAILKLLAGERELVALDPEDVQEVLRAESEAVVPDTGAFRDFAGARILLRAEAVRNVLDEQSAYAPPESEPEPSPLDYPDDPAPAPDIAPDPPVIIDPVPIDPPPVPAPEPLSEPPLPTPPPSPIDPPRDAPAVERRSSALVFEPVEAPVACPECHRSLPSERTVSFCPFCGTLVTPGTCVRCGDAIEPTWRYCGTCGQSSSG
jgi:hypothetical protein